MKRKVKAMLATGALAGLGLVAGPQISSAVGFRTQTPPPATFDPVTAALGVDTPAEQDALADGLVAINGSTNGTPRTSMVRKARDDFNAAVDELYEDAAAEPEGEDARDEWRDCMLDAGFDFDSPQEIADITDPTVTPDDAARAGINWDKVFRTDEDCTAETAQTFEPAVERLYPSWRTANDAAIDAYADQLGL